MAPGDEILRPLREALAVSPNNLPLRQHLAETLLRLGRQEEAEAEFRAALALAPSNQGLKLGLAQTFHQLGKHSHALVIVEDLLSAADVPAAAVLLHARLLLRSGEVQRAVSEFRRAVELDPALADDELAETLGIRVEAEVDDSDDTAEVSEGRLRISTGEPDAAAGASRMERPKVGFADVGGMDELKEQIRLKIIYPLEHAEMFRAYGKAVGGGILMYGPPGCGKTYLARATAGEIQAGFLSVGLNDVLDMWIGNSERNLHELFEHARGHQPCVLFFDEVDALGASRVDMRHSAGRHLINQFLAELDGANASNEGVLVLGATNAPWHLDAAFRRPGRFDRIIFVPPPDLPARAAVLRVLLRGKPIGDIDYEGVAKKCDGFSGADLKALVDVTVEAKLAEAMKSGRPTPLGQKDLLAATKSVKPTTREWFATARNHALYSNQSGVYDEILKYLKM